MNIIYKRHVSRETLKRLKTTKRTKRTKMTNKRVTQVPLQRTTVGALCLAKSSEKTSRFKAKCSPCRLM
jgi:Flp pilus assembly protein TadG